MQNQESRLFQGALKTQYGYRDVKPADLLRDPSLASSSGVRVIDVREPAEFTGELGHIPGAELSPLGGVAAAAARWDRAQEILLVCRSGGRSARAAVLLVGLGFQRVMNLAGGMMAYRSMASP